MLVFEERGKAEYQGQIEEFFIGGRGGVQIIGFFNILGIRFSGKMQCVFHKTIIQLKKVIYDPVDVRMSVSNKCQVKWREGGADPRRKTLRSKG